MTASRPPIPASVKREVRQACAFGCVLCGKPIYHYDHITPYSDVKEHTVQNLALLCPDHHEAKTRGLLSSEEVAEARADPFNLSATHSTPHPLGYFGSSSKTILGSNTHFWPQMPYGSLTIPLIIDDTPIVLFRSTGKQLFLTAQILDSDNRLAVQIRENELTFSTQSYDVEFVGTTLTVRNGPGDILSKMRFAPRQGEIEITRAKIHRNGIAVDISKNGLVLPGRNLIAGATITNALTGIGIGDTPPFPGAIKIGSTREAWDTDADTERRLLRLVDRT